MLKNKFILSGLMCCFGNISAGSYGGSAIDRKANQIRTQYINLSSTQVANQERPILSRRFELFLSNDKSMQKIKKINEEGTSDTTLEVTGLEEAIAEDWKQKENALKEEHAWCLPKQIGSGFFATIGVATISAGLNQRRPDNKTVLVVGGAAIGIAGLVGLYFMAGKKGRIENHIVQVQMMHEEWDKFFEMPDKK